MAENEPKFINSIWWNLPAYVDRWRIFPRVFLSMYIYLLYKVVIWFMTLDAPTMEQAGLVSIIVGVGAPWFTSYLSAPAKTLSDPPEKRTHIE
jgi:hypothetical protein